ncbi:MAG TPA: NAD-dependent malic enzyme [Methylomirabilota bacterium]|nr:NAD-dependent malic enzyme [Methylomirabilota bacterium]
MPRDPQVPQFFRTLRVKNVNQVGVLAAVLSVIARHGGSVGDIRTVQQSRTFMVRDIDIIMETLEEFDALVVDLDSHEESTVVELRDEVLTAHLGGKIRVVSRAPIDTFADLGRVYTPGVGEVCRRISEDARLADNYTIIPNTCAIVSDGSAVLGLGNLGATAAMPVLEGKAALLAHLAGVNAIPIALKSQDPGDIVEAVAAISATFGVIQLEDIASPKCFDVEPALQEKVDIAVFHDDQHGTAAVVLATLINACALTGLFIDELRVGQIGLGAAGLAIARSVMHYTGNPVLGADRVPEPMDRLASWGGTPATIDEIFARCDVVIATTGRPGLITPDMVRPGQLIFALSNPRPEIDAAEALDAGARIAESGAAVNNLLCYPGACRGLLDTGARRAPQEVFRAASEAIVAVTPPNQLLPSPLDRSVHRAVARAVARAAMDHAVATREPPAGYFED